MGAELPAPEPTGRPDEIFRLRDVSYRYLDRFVALDSVDLSIMRGERIALIGANGCGKSTLLKVLDALAFPQSGIVRAFGQLADERAFSDRGYNAAFRSRVGFVFQDSQSQVFSPTVRDEIAFGPRQLGLGADEVERRVNDIVAMLGIADLLERAPHQLSGGQTKRVAIASVLVMRPEVMLFDEPTAALDPRTRTWLLGLLDQLHAVGTTIVVATHDLDRMAQQTDRCVVFGEDHRIAADAPTSEVLADRALLRSVNLVDN